MTNEEECLQQFKTEYSERLGAVTLQIYLIAIRQLLTYCDKSFQDIKTQDIRKWMNHLQTNGYKPVTIKNKIFGIKLFYRYCCEESLITSNPVERILLPVVNEKLPHYLKDSELIQLRNLVKNNPVERAMIEMLYATGVRISEMADIKLTDINWSERLIHIPKGKRKKARIVPFTRNCLEYMEGYLVHRKDSLPYLFLNTTGTDQVCVRTIQKKFKNYSKKLGTSISPHTMRHTFAAHLAIKGMPLNSIQVLLGHNSPYQTQLYARLYNHARKLKYDELM